ncbi:MAG: sensor domain-containing protein [Anaerolineaceae bacterium]|nr:sensor domain-containing protein [Anaerolineaceae bacterium]
MSQTIENYLSQLKVLMKNRDPATVRDAQADAEEYLRSAMDGQDSTSLDAIIEEYGTPEETAAAYQMMEKRMNPSLSVTQTKTDRPWLGRFFGVFGDARAWGSVLYMLISLITGTLYFSWAVTGLSLSLSMSIMIFGIPLAALILLSFRGLAWFEGRIVEALLGVRMPRRPVFARKDVTWKEKLKAIFASKVTWFSTLFLIVQFPLGIIYFVLFITLFSVGLAFLAVPVLQYVYHLPTIAWGGRIGLIFEPWTMVLFVVGGVLLLTVNMHLAKGLGSLHAKLARALLVAE